MFDPLHVPDRELLDATELERLRATVIVDEHRRRPLYFDGRFLAARDLTREQGYFLSRQADLGRAGGFGVVHGLMVERGGTATSLRIGAGHGITPAGEVVAIPTPLTVELADLPTIQRLNATFGLLEIPREPLRTRSGLFVLALRPVEFTANPVAVYPTSITGQRGSDDGEIVEGTVVTLIPYPDEGTAVSAAQRRARVAREIFAGGSARGLAPGVLPLALLALNRGVVEWLDPFLVRREVGADHGDVLGLGFAPRAVREAHLLQYENHLQEVLDSRGGVGDRFPALDYFHLLPPAGRIPAAAVDPRDFSQVYFPSTVDVDLSIIPEDEIPALLEESLLLPPIDLTLSAEELDSTGVVVLIPVPRAQLRTLSSRLTRTARSLRPPTPWLVARRRPLEVLQSIRIPGNFIPLPDPENPEDAVWRELMAGGGLFWYVRRRNLSYRADLSGEIVVLPPEFPYPYPFPYGEGQFYEPQAMIGLRAPVETSEGAAVAPAEPEPKPKPARRKEEPKEEAAAPEPAKPREKPEAAPEPAKPRPEVDVEFRPADALIADIPKLKPTEAIRRATQEAPKAAEPAPKAGETAARPADRTIKPAGPVNPKLRGIDKDRPTGGGK